MGPLHLRLELGRVASAAPEPDGDPRGPRCGRPHRVPGRPRHRRRRVHGELPRSGGRSQRLSRIASGAGGTLPLRSRHEGGTSRLPLRPVPTCTNEGHFTTALRADGNNLPSRMVASPIRLDGGIREPQLSPEVSGKQGRPTSRGLEPGNLSGLGSVVRRHEGRRGSRGWGAGSAAGRSAVRLDRPPQVLLGEHDVPPHGVPTACSPRVPRIRRRRVRATVFSRQHESSRRVAPRRQGVAKEAGRGLLERVRVRHLTA